MAAAVVLDVPKRSDALVEERLLSGDAWPDDGCDLAPKCLQCPFAKCRYDYQSPGLGLARSLEMAERHQRVAELEQEGKSAREIAAEAGVSMRTVFRLRSGR